MYGQCAFSFGAQPPPVVESTHVCIPSQCDDLVVPAPILNYNSTRWSKPAVTVLERTTPVAYYSLSPGGDDRPPEVPFAVESTPVSYYDLTVSSPPSP